MVADERSRALVKGERCRTVRAFGHEATFATEHEGGESAPVEQQDGLLAPFVYAMQRLDECLGEHGARPAPELGGHVDYLHVGKGLATWPFAERDMLPRTLAANAART